MKPQECGSDLRRFNLHIYIIAALLGGAALLFSGCVNDIEIIKAFSSPEALPVIHAENYETTYTDSGVVRFFLKTPELMRFEVDGQPFIEFPKGIELTKYNEHHQVVSRITARYAKQYVKEKKWEAKNDVVALNLAGDTLKTEHLIWDEQTGKITSDQFVKIIRPDQIITGIGFESDQSMENWRIRNPKGTIYIQLNREDSEIPVEESTDRELRPMDIQIQK